MDDKTDFIATQSHDNAETDKSPEKHSEGNPSENSPLIQTEEETASAESGVAAAKKETSVALKKTSRFVRWWKSLGKRPKTALVLCVVILLCLAVILPTVLSATSESRYTTYFLYENGEQNNDEWYRLYVDGNWKCSDGKEGVYEAGVNEVIFYVSESGGRFYYGTAALADDVLTFVVGEITKVYVKDGVTPPKHKGQSYAVTVDGGYINDPSVTERVFPLGSVVTLYPVVPEGKVFCYWLVNGERITENPYLLVVSETTTVMAVFDFPSEGVTVTSWYLSGIPTYSKAGEALSLSGAYVLMQYSDGSSETLSVTLDMLQGFDGSVGAKFVVFSYKGVSKQFELYVTEGEIPRETVKVEGGTLLGGATTAVFPRGTTLTVIRSLHEGIFDGWTLDGQGFGGDIHTFILDKSLTVKAIYREPPVAGCVFAYDEQTSSYRLTAYTGTETKAVIPTTFDDGEHGVHSVTAISAGAFGGTSVEEVTFPATLREVGDNAFRGCSSLSRVNVNDGLTSIAPYAFYNCESLSSVVLPDTVTHIGGDAFTLCSLTVLCEGDSQPDGWTEGWNGDCGVSFGTVGEGTYGGYRYSLTSVGLDILEFSGDDVVLDIPSQINGKDVVSIADKAFAGCTSLQTVFIPQTVTYIGKQAFLYCGNLANVIFLGNPPSLAEEAFKTSLTYVQNFFVDADAEDAFYSSDLADYLSGANHLKINNIDAAGYVIENGHVTGYVGSSSTVVIPEGVTSIAGGVFRDRDELRKVILPVSLTTVSQAAFYGCKNLELFVMAQSGSEYFRCDGGVLYNAAGTMLVCYPNGKKDKSFAAPVNLTSVAKAAFASCEYVEEITFGALVSTLGQYAFADCKNLKSVTFSSSAPPVSMDGVALSDLNPDVKLKVPLAAYDAYAAAQGWARYSARLETY